MHPTGCPEPTELAEFVTGDLPRPAFARIAAHVEQCAGCAATLETFDDAADSFLCRLRQSASHENMDEEPVPPALLAIARSAREGGGTAGSSSERRRLDRFDLLQELGVGSFGQVFRARDLELDRTVAIKILRAGRLASLE